jgi:hypothetical protein
LNWCYWLIVMSVIGYWNQQSFDLAGQDIQHVDHYLLD